MADKPEGFEFKLDDVEPYTNTIPVPQLEHIFPEGWEAEIKVQAVLGHRIYGCQNVDSVEKVLRNSLEAVHGGDSAEVVKLEMDKLGFGEGIPTEMRQDIQWCVEGITSPKWDRPQIVKLFNRYTALMRAIAQSIRLASSVGSVPGKPTASGKTPKSEAA